MLWCIFSEIRQLDMGHGEELVIAGASRNGKSALLKFISSLLRSTAGQVIFEGRPISQIRPTEYPKDLSYCFQSPQLPSETVNVNDGIASVIACYWTYSAYFNEYDQLIEK